MQISFLIIAATFLAVQFLSHEIILNLRLKYVPVRTVLTISNNNNNDNGDDIIIMFIYIVPEFVCSLALHNIKYKTTIYQLKYIFRLAHNCE